MKRGIIAALVITVIAAAALFAVNLYTSRDPGQESRREEWAVPLEKPGLANLHRVTEDFYRGAQPTAEGMKELEAMGVKTVVNLRSFHSDRDELEGTSLAYEHISMKTWHSEDEDVVRLLRIVTDPERAPVFVHCQRGADRTGMMCAIYRVGVCGWTKEEAKEEMLKGGFGFAVTWQNMVRYFEKLDVEKSMAAVRAQRKAEETN